MTLIAMPWVGGKSTARNDGNGAWIASQLPPVETGQAYTAIRPTRQGRSTRRKWTGMRCLPSLRARARA